MNKKDLEKIIKEETLDTLNSIEILEEEVFKRVKQFFSDAAERESFYDVMMSLKDGLTAERYLHLKTNERQKIADILGMDTRTLDVYAKFSVMGVEDKIAKATPWNAKIEPTLRRNTIKMLDTLTRDKR